MDHVSIDTSSSDMMEKESRSNSPETDGTMPSQADDIQQGQDHGSDMQKNENSTPKDVESARDDGEADLRPLNHETGERLSLSHECLIIIIIALAQIMTQAGLGQVLSALQIIGSFFDLANPGERSWLIAGYSLTVGTFILIAGRFGDIFGHKLLFVIGFAWFGLWSLLAGFAVYSNSIFFDFCRGFQGMGPAIALPNALAMLGVLYPPGPRKDMAFAIFGSTAPGGSVIGAVFSALFAQLAWWPWAFWVMGIACFVVAILAWLAIPYAKFHPHGPYLQRLDALGSLFGIAGLVLINVAWNQG